MIESNSDKHLTYFKVEGFKNFSSLELTDIGLINVIVGDNNAGKTNLLEALCFEENDYSKYIYTLAALSISRFRPHSEKRMVINFLDNYFNIKQENRQFKIDYRNTATDFLSVKHIDKKSLTDLEIEEIKLLNIIDNISPQTMENVYRISSNSSSNVLTPNYSQHRSFNSVDNYLPFISSHQGHGIDLVNFYSDTIAFNKSLKSQLIEYLKIFNDKVDYIDLGSSKTLPESEILIGFENENIAQPLSMFGDGFIKYFRILLEILKTKDNRLMIDEIDNGIHYSKQANFIKKIILLAIENKTQIFCTTHSKECLNAFKEAFESTELKEYQNLFRNYSLNKIKSGEIKAYRYNYEEFVSTLISDADIRGGE